MCRSEKDQADAISPRAVGLVCEEERLAGDDRTERMCDEHDEIVRVARSSACRRRRQRFVGQDTGVPAGSVEEPIESIAGYEDQILWTVVAVIDVVAVPSGWVLLHQRRELRPRLDSGAAEPVHEDDQPTRGGGRPVCNGTTPLGQLDRPVMRWCHTSLTKEQSRYNFPVFLRYDKRHLALGSASRRAL